MKSLTPEQQAFAEEHLSEKYYYPRNCNESMSIKGCFIDFLG